jgi:hypothetical protein
MRSVLRFMRRARVRRNVAENPFGVHFAGNEAWFADRGFQRLSCLVD